MSVAGSSLRTARSIAAAAILAWWTFPAVAEDGFASHPLWDDGKAEVSLYDAEEPRYGVTRSFEARMIVVKEDFRTDSKVKSEGGPVPGETREVLKLNHIRTIRTGTYDYQQMLSAYLDRDSLQPIKMTMAHFEACGITFVEVLPGGGRLSHVSHSYWEGEGDRTLEIQFGAEDLLRDALPLQLRGIDFSRQAPLEVRVLPSQISGRVVSPALVPMTLRVKGKARTQVPAGSFETYELELAGRDGGDRYFFEVSFPHRLIRLERAGGGVYKLRKSLRLDYWNHHGVGDEKLLQ